MSKKININDMSQKLNVSTATVSLALKGDSRVKPATSERVKKLAQELNYFPNIFARGLVRQASTTLIVLLPLVKNVMEYPDILSALKGIYDALENTDYKVLMEINNSSFRARRDYIKPFMNGTACGMLLLGSTVEDEFIREISDMNVVQIGSYHPDIETSFVTGDNIKAGKLAAEYLLSKYPDKKFGIIYGPGTIMSLNERKKGFLAVIKRAGKKIDASLIVESARVTASDAKVACQKLIAQEVEVIFCCNDIMARGCYGLIQNMAKKQAKRIKLMGIDGTIRAIERGITTINYPVEEMAKSATQSIIYNRLPIHKILNVELNIGNTA